MFARTALKTAAPAARSSPVARLSLMGARPLAARGFQSTALKRDEARPEIDTPPSLYKLTEEEAMLQETGELPLSS